MKKLIALCLAFLLLAGLSVPAFAAYSPERSPEEEGGTRRIYIRSLVIVDEEFDHDAVTGYYIDPTTGKMTEIDPVTGEKSEVIVCVEKLCDRATDQMREDYEKLKKDTAKDAEKALTAANANSAVEAAVNKYPKILSQLDNASVTASTPVTIVASVYPCMVKMIIRKNPKTVLFPMLFDGKKWSVPEELTVTHETEKVTENDKEVEKDIVTLLFRLDEPSYLTLVRMAGGAKAP